MPKTKTFLLAAAVAALPAVAAAHPGHDSATLLGGLEHPFTGIDHILAMVSVGLWAALRGGRALWAWPTAFIGAMAGGFLLARLGVALPLTEPAILASIMVLGALTAANARVATLAGVGLIAVFGTAHGLAHGVEAGGNGVGFPLGMVLATAGLHGLGLGAGLGLQRLKRPAIVRMLGAGAALGGVALAIAG